MATEQKPVHTPPSRDECVHAMLAHALGVTISFIGPLIIRRKNTKQSEYIHRHATEAVNFQITLGTILLICWNFLPHAWFALMLSAYLTLNALLSIPAMIAASRGETYRYWLSIRIIL